MFDAYGVAGLSDESKGMISQWTWRSPRWCGKLKRRPRWPSKNYVGEESMSYLLLLALGLLFLSASFLVSQSTARTALVVLACFAFLIAVILTIVGTVGVSVG